LFLGEENVQVYFGDDRKQLNFDRDQSPLTLLPSHYAKTKSKMRTALSLAFAFSFVLTPSWATLRAPESFLRSIDSSSTTEGEHAHHRDLLPMLFGGCQRALTTCQDATRGVTDLPTEAWVSQLESLDPSSADPYVAELKKIVLAANQPESDFEDFVNGIKNNGKVFAMMSLVRKAQNLNGLQPEQLIQNMIDILTSLKDMARQTPGFLEILVYALEFAVRLIELMASDPAPLDILLFALKEIVTFVVTFVVQSARVSVLRADPKCAAQLVQCSYNKMMLNAMPSLMQTVAVAEGLSSSGGGNA